jgi:hypothetical protein
MKLNLHGIVDLFMECVMGMQIQQRITARRKITLTMNMSAQSVSHAHSQGEKCFQREKTVSFASEIFLILIIQYSK